MEDEGLKDRTIVLEEAAKDQRYVKGKRRVMWRGKIDALDPVPRLPQPQGLGIGEMLPDPPNSKNGGHNAFDTPLSCPLSMYVFVYTYYKRFQDALFPI
ncbi:hypothetical protein KQX54_011760 [Cotesia glomerata]|uniref:Uncharacterized protein n=1 Tax=Cotesia glomerata TaxID=32391 RepID=A0AAV7J8M8_COTGL|nr:hypothetical protein KQX54_011760 [Cotesia glomerata]